MDKCFGSAGCPFLVDTVGGLDLTSSPSYFECNQDFTKCRLTTASFERIRAEIAGEWKCETCRYFDQHAAAFGETRCGLRHIDPMWSGECVPCGEWEKSRDKEK